MMPRCRTHRAPGRARPLAANRGRLQEPGIERIPEACAHPDCVEKRARAAKDGKPATGWTHRKHAAVTEDELAEIYSTARSGVGLVCGAVSGGLELLEWEGRAVEGGVLDDFMVAANAAGLGDLFDRVAAGYSERSPSGGVHILYRCPKPRTTKLARRPATAAELALEPDDKVKVLIETKGEGGYVIVAPTNGRVHPDGGAWELVLGGFDTIVTVTAEEHDELLALARTFDEMPVQEQPHQRESARTGAGGLRPGDDFNLRADWANDVIGPHGWTFVFSRGSTSYWRRPGKSRGWSATTNHTGNDTLIVFSSNTPFESWEGDDRPAPSYSKFTAYAVLNHRGDFEAAARALGERGYGALPAPDARVSGCRVGALHRVRR